MVRHKLNRMTVAVGLCSFLVAVPSMIEAQSRKSARAPVLISFQPPEHPYTWESKGTGGTITMTLTTGAGGTIAKAEVSGMSLSGGTANMFDWADLDRSLRREIERVRPSWRVARGTPPGVVLTKVIKFVGAPDAPTPAGQYPRARNMFGPPTMYWKAEKPSSDLKRPGEPRVYQGGKQISGPIIPTVSRSNCPSPEVYYPPSALRQGRSGRVKLGLDVDSKGAPTYVRVYTSSGADDLDTAAISFARACSFIGQDRYGGEGELTIAFAPPHEPEPARQHGVNAPVREAVPPAYSYAPPVEQAVAPRPAAPTFWEGIQKIQNDLDQRIKECYRKGGC